MYILSKIKRAAACCLAVLMTVGAVGIINNENSVTISASPDDVSYEQRLKEIEEEQSELDEKIAEAEKSINGEKDKLEAVNKKITTLKKKIKTVEEYAAQTENEMVELDAKVHETQYELSQMEQEIKTGVNDFMGRVRAMYVAGTDTYTDVIVNSSDFYDVLMRLELVKRVAEHDNDAINALIAQKEDIEKTESELEKQSEELKEKSKKYGEQQKSLADEQKKLYELQKEYDENISKLEGDKSDYENQSQKLENEYSKVSSLAESTTTTTRKTATTTKKSVATTTKKTVTDPTETAATTTAVTTAPPSETTAGTQTVTAQTTAAQTTEPPKDDTPIDSSKADIVVSYAKSMVGGSYVWGGSSFGATDCSGLIMLSYQQVGISLPHLASAQASYGTNVAYSDMQPGDCIFFGYGSYSSIYHVAMYIGGGRMVHAENSYTGIVISDVATFSRYNSITCIKRIL